MGKSHHIFESLFKMKSYSEDAANYLERMAADYPYFSPLQFFYLQQVTAGTEAYNLQVARTSLFFNNAHWLNFQLAENEHETYAEEITEAAEDHEVPVAGGDIGSIEMRDELPAGEEPAAGALTETVDKHIRNTISFPEDDINESSRLPGEESVNQDENIINQDNIDSLLSASNKENSEIETAEKPGIIEHADQEDKKLDEFQPLQTKEIIPAEGESLNQSQAEHLKGNELPAREEENSTDEHRFNSGSTEYETQGEPQAATPIPSPSAINNAGVGDHGMSQEADPDDQELTPIGHDTTDDKPLNFKLNLEPSSTEQKDIAFEPLHTTDYFASQGIKLSGEIKPTDKLGKQLKSFTEWLKTMKKIHTDKLEQSSGQADQVIQTLAEKSNAEDEVLTEAMAEVLLQQGKTDKAIDVYKKLSLLSPTKSAYFAAKIDQLK
jgi:hypothetical protein